MKLIYDMHSHILPGMDDGAKDVSESRKIISSLAKNGVKNICLTPHFYTHKESISDFLKRREESYSKLLSATSDFDVNFIPSAEVFVTKYLFSGNKNLFSVCYENTCSMLTEFPYDSHFHGDTMRSIELLISTYGVHPVLAHVERYPYLMKNLSALEELIYMGVTIQSNACSFSRFPQKIKLFSMLKNGYIQIIGSDAHSMERNSPEAFAPFTSDTVKKYGTDKILEINNNCKEILEF